MQDKPVPKKQYPEIKPKVDVLESAKVIDNALAAAERVNKSLIGKDGLRESLLQKEMASSPKAVDKYFPRKKIPEQVIHKGGIFNKVMNRVADRYFPRSPKAVDKYFPKKIVEDAVKASGVGAVTYGLLASEDSDWKTAGNFLLLSTFGIGGIKGGAKRFIKRTVNRVSTDGFKFITRPIERIAKKGSKASGEAQQYIINTITDAKSSKIKYDILVEDFFKDNYGVKDVLTKIKDKKYIRENFKDMIEHPGKFKAPNERIQKFIDLYKKITNEIGVDLEKLGHEVIGKKGKKQPFKRIEHYFRHSLTDEARSALETKQGSLYDAIVKEAKRIGIDVSIYSGDFLDNFSVKKLGSVDYSRTASLPSKVKVNGKIVNIFETDPFKIIPKYIEETTKRTSILRTFGKNANKKAQEIAQKLEKEEGSYAVDAFRDAWADMNGFPVDTFNKGHWFAKVGDAALQTFRTGQLTLATVANTAGYFPAWVRASSKPFIKGFYNSFKNPSKSMDLAEARRNGGWAYDTMNNLYMTSDLSGAVGKGARGTLKSVGFNAINRNINKVTSLSAKYDLMRGLDLIKQGKGGVFRQMWGYSSKAYRSKLKRYYKFTDADINRMMEKGANQKDLARVQQMAPEAINLYNESGIVKPRILSQYGARQLMTYTGFTRGYGNQIMDIIHFAKEGNIAPLAKWFFGTQVSGAVAIKLRNMIFDRQREDANWLSYLWHNTLAAGGLGLVGAAAEQFEFAFRYNESPVNITPPHLEPLNNLYDMTIDIAEKDKSFKEALFGRTGQSIPMIKALVLNYNKYLGDEMDYVANRVKYDLYLGSGTNSEGNKYKMGDTKPGARKNTSDMLTARVGGGKRVAKYIKKQKKK